jgi:hypothetical protein
MKFDIRVFFDNSPKKIEVSLKDDKNNGYFIWSVVFIYIS